ncbi:hypothetical protein L211DRAFT_849342 [Terfezia boudieri ATCC MYA-4762]|uniref:Uncharacterized protein n=1 Tax=Terfezia boudieri ATCC MYA-4762 TaxID=1051890 RepID=A0A3N4LLM8_9PEZI|nr:hypothetical protein L211DRAFT_849342 [Terfezia boudieri ATCC MYA-4762]
MFAFPLSSPYPTPLPRAPPVPQTGWSADLPPPTRHAAALFEHGTALSQSGGWDSEMDKPAAEVADTSAIHTPRARSARSTILPAPTPAGHSTGVAVHLQTGRIQDAPSSPSPSSVSRASHDWHICSSTEYSTTSSHSLRIPRPLQTTKSWYQSVHQ